jgi:osmoprotectant transport system permease protein
LPPAAAPTLTVGSKRFTESYVLGEVIAQGAEAAGEAAVVRRPGLGNTAIVLHALQSGAIDVYPEYTGTIAREILKLDAVPELAELNFALAKMGLAASVPLGFNNTYGLAMRTGMAQNQGISRISDLAAHPDLRLGLSQEFLGRADGWPGLQRAYGLDGATPRGLDHGLAYEALAQGQVDVIDVYATDAGLERYGLTVLRDDRRYFPRYDGVLLHRAELPARLPRTWAALETLHGRIDDAQMRRMNVAVEVDRKDFAAIAADFLSRSEGVPAAAGHGGLRQALLAPDLARLAAEHFALVFLSLTASMALGVPLGILAAKRRRAGRLILGAAGVVQTLPALALLAFLITLTGRIGAVPAFIALALYALLPIVRNTHAGLS